MASELFPGDQRTPKPALPNPENAVEKLPTNPDRERELNEAVANIGQPRPRRPYPPAPLTPAEHTRKEIDRARAVAGELKRVIDGMSKTARPWKVQINGQDYVRFEGLQFVASRWSLTVRIAEAPRKLDDGAWLARAIVLNREGHEVGEAWGLCSLSEPNRRGGVEAQAMAMAQTRACSRALRQVVGWIISLAGYPGTPAEEME